MHLVINQVTQFQHINYADSCRLVKTFTCSTVIEICFTEIRNTCSTCCTGNFISFTCFFRNIFQRSTIKNRCSIVLAEFFSCPAQYCFVNLSDVHTRRHTKRVKNYIDNTSVSQERHIFVAYDTRNNTLVTVTTCHLITDFQFTFLCDIHFRQLYDSRRKFVPDRNSILFTFVFTFNFFMLSAIVVKQFRNQFVLRTIRCPFFCYNIRIVLNFIQKFLCKLSTFRNQDISSIIFHTLRSLAFSKFEQFLDKDICQLLTIFIVFSLVTFENWFFVSLSFSVFNTSCKQFLVYYRSIQ